MGKNQPRPHQILEVESWKSGPISHFIDEDLKNRKLKCFVQGHLVPESYIKVLTIASHCHTTSLDGTSQGNEWFSTVPTYQWTAQIHTVKLLSVKVCVCLEWSCWSEDSKPLYLT